MKAEKLNLHWSKGVGATPFMFLRITFLRVKQNEQGFTYSYLDNQEQEEGVKFQTRSGNKVREKKNLRKKLECKKGFSGPKICKCEDSIMLWLI